MLVLQPFYTAPQKLVEKSPPTPIKWFYDGHGRIAIMMFIYGAYEDLSTLFMQKTGVTILHDNIFRLFATLLWIMVN